MTKMSGRLDLSAWILNHGNSEPISERLAREQCQETTSALETLFWFTACAFEWKQGSTGSPRASTPARSLIWALLMWKGFTPSHILRGPCNCSYCTGFQPEQAWTLPVDSFGVYSNAGFGKGRLFKPSWHSQADVSLRSNFLFFISAQRLLRASPDQTRPVERLLSSTWMLKPKSPFPYPKKNLPEPSIAFLTMTLYWVAHLTAFNFSF